MNQFTRLNVSYLNEVWLERQYVRVVECEGLRSALPLNLPVLSSTPAIPVDEKAEVRVVEKELSVHSLDVDWSHVLFACDEVQGSIRLIQ